MGRFLSSVVSFLIGWMVYSWIIFMLMSLALVAHHYLTLLIQTYPLMSLYGVIVFVLSVCAYAEAMHDKN